MKLRSTLLALAAALLAGCAGTAPTEGAPREGGITVFGTIDAGVSRNSTRR